MGRRGPRILSGCLGQHVQPVNPGANPGQRGTSGPIWRVGHTSPAATRTTPHRQARACEVRCCANTEAPLGGALADALRDPPRVAPSLRQHS